MSRDRRIDGKVSNHAVQRYLKQYHFEGNEYEAKKVLAAYGALTENQTDRIEMSLENLEKTGLKGELKRKTERTIRRNRFCDLKTLFVEKSFGRIENVKHIPLKKSPFLAKPEDKGLYLHLRSRFAGAY